MPKTCAASSWARRTQSGGSTWRDPAHAAALGLIALLNGACSTVSEAVSDATPYGVQLRERVEEWDRWCKGEKLGPYNTDPRRAHITTCDFLYLKDQRWDPNADEFSRYAHSIKLPPPHDQPQAQYRPGMTSKQYFEELCAKEAGQWIFRKVNGVRGLLQARAYVPTSPFVSLLIPNTQEPDVSGGNFDYFWTQVSEERSKFERDKFSGYTFLETPSHRTTGFRTYYRSIGDLERSHPGRQPEWEQYRNLYKVPFVVNPTPRAEYAFVWRGVFRPEFVEHGIEGGELVIVSYRTREPLGFIRSFRAMRPEVRSSGDLNLNVEIVPCLNQLGFGPLSLIQQVLFP